MMGSRAFSRLLVVGFGDSAAGSYCAKLFADYGAEVVVIEDAHKPEPNRAGSDFYHASVHRWKQGDPGLERLLAEADLIIQADATTAITEPMDPVDDRQIVLRISPFAATGPYARWQSTDLVDAAIAGHLRLSGDPDREPLQGVPEIVHHAAGVMGFIAATAALVARARTGRGQVVETSHQEVVAALHQFTLCRFTHNGAVLNRLGNQYAGPGAPIGAYECADGWIGLALPQDDQVERMLAVTGLITMLDRPDVDSVWDLMTNRALLDSELVPYLKTQKRDETVELFQAMRLPCAPVADLDDVLCDPHLEARNHWSDGHTGASGSPLRLPGAPFQLSGHDWSVGPKRRSVGQADPGPESKPDSSARAISDTAPDLSDGPLTGLRVLDMTRVWAGPLATRILADLGAEVLMTEVPWTRTPREVPDSYVMGTRFFPDDEAGPHPWNRSGFHNKYANNKLSTVIELDKPQGRDLFAALVPHADLLVENYSPRVMPGFGFDAETLHRLNPDLIYVTMPGYGREGPNTDWVAYGPTIDGHVGHTSLTGYRGEGPWKCGIAWPDPIGGMHGAAGALVALLDRFDDPADSTGKNGRPRGQTVEVAQIESAVHMIGQHLVAAQLDGIPPRLGNRSARRAPQGVYPARGQDRWIAISVTDDEAWRALCREADLDRMAEFDLEQRTSQHDEIDRCLAAFTAQYDDVELMHRLQAAGVAAGAALAAPEIMSDPQLQHLDFFVDLDHPEAGTHPWPRFPARLSGTPATMRSPAALMGQHNEYAAKTLAGLSDDAYEELVAAGVLRTDPPA